MNALAVKTREISLRLNRVVEVVCVVLLVLLVLDVWLGIVARYLIPLPITFTEELARYLMIWMALLAVSCGIVHKEHIGVEFLFSRFPAGLRRFLAVAFDVLSFGFFLVLFWYGLGFAERGFSRVTMIYAMPKGYAFSAVPAAAAVACLQIALKGISDALAARAPKSTGAMSVGGELE